MEKTFGPPHMRMVELPLSAVVVDPSFNCREPYTAEEIGKACVAFETQPMLHAPAVARVEGQWMLVSGFLRMAVWLTKELEVGVFRWIESDDLAVLARANLAENVARQELKMHELVERLTFLRESGVDPELIAQDCGYSVRHVRRVCTLKRCAHPKLWETFVAGHDPHLTMRRMLDLADHAPAQQLERWQQMHEAGELADEHARGYSQGPNGANDGPSRDTPMRTSTGLGATGGRSGKRARRRLPARRQVEQLYRLIEREPTMEASYRRGMVEILRWLLHGDEMQLQVSTSSLRAPRRAPESGSSSPPEAAE